MKEQSWDVQFLVDVSPWVHASQKKRLPIAVASRITCSLATGKAQGSSTLTGAGWAGERGAAFPLHIMGRELKPVLSAWMF